MHSFTVIEHPTPTPADEIAKVFSDPGFGLTFTDHIAVVDWTADEGWANARIQPYGPISLDPAASVLHYANEVFEGIKAYRHPDGGVYTFRPQKNAARLNASARRMSLPEMNEQVFVSSIEELVRRDHAWVPADEGKALYLRPYMFATEAFLGVRKPREVTFRVIASPVGGVFGKTFTPVRIWVSRDYARAALGGTGAAKTGGNYAGAVAASSAAAAHGCQQVLFLDQTGEAVEELGAMNIFLVTKDGTLLTPQLTGTILDGITRASLIQLAKDRGLAVEERRITLDEWAEGAANGTITEAFACGTAAVVAPIGELVDGDQAITMAGDFSITRALKNELVGIQSGLVEDRHGWLHRLV